MIIIFLIFSLLSGICLGKEQLIKASIGQIPVVSESAEKGVYPESVIEIEKISGIKIDIKVVPFERSLNMAIKGDADFHIPIIETDIGDAPYFFSSEILHKMAFAIYSNKNNPIDKDHLEDKAIESDSAHVKLFPFKTIPSTCLECSLKKVNYGRIDGFVYAFFAADKVIRAEKLYNIHRELYKNYSVKALIAKTKRGKYIDQFLTKYISILKKNGTWNIYYPPEEDIYTHWQPHDLKSP